MEVDQIPITYIATVAAGFPLSSSSDKHHLSSASRAVINQMPANSASGIYDAWCAGFLDTNQWIQVSFITPRTVVSIATQGRHGNYEWVSSYKIQYTIDGMTWYWYDQVRVFKANTDDSSVVTNRLDDTFVARAVRISPQAWNNYISMRVEVNVTSEISLQFIIEPNFALTLRYAALIMYSVSI